MKIKCLSVIASLFALSFAADCSASSPVDDHSFLFKKFPKLRQQADGLPVIENHEDKLSRISHLEDGTALTYKQDYLDNGFFKGPAVCLSVEDRRLIHQAEQAHLRLKKRDMAEWSPFYNLYFNRKIDAAATLSIVEDIKLAADEISFCIHKMRITEPGTVGVVFLGRTPCLIQVAMEQIQKKYPSPNNPALIHVNYSGCADALTKREDIVYQGDKDIARNMVTPEKLEFYMGYLAMKKLQLYKKIIIVDMITTGGGLNSWLRLLKTFCKQRDLVMPQLHFMALTHFPYSMDVLIDSQLNKNQFWTYNRKAGAITFKKDDRYNIHGFTLPTTPIHIFDVTGEFLDDDCVQRYAVHGYVFPPQMWRKDCFAVAEKGGEWHQESYPSFRRLIDSLLIIHENMMLMLQKK